MDTLNLHVGGRVLADQLEILLQAKETAVSRAKEGDDRPVVWTSGSIALEVKPHGGRRGPLLLDSELLALSINPNAPAGLPTAIVEVRSLFLWQRGYRVAVAQVEELFRSLGLTEPLQLSRVDLCTDFQGWVPTFEQLPSFTCRGRNRDVHFGTSKRFTGFSFGHGALHARLYDKRAEAVVSSKEGIVEELWGESNEYVYAICSKCGPREKRDTNEFWEHANPRTKASQRPAEPRKLVLCGACEQEVEVQPVWRLEFQVRREGLRETQVLDEETGELLQRFTDWNTAQRELGGLWQYLGTTWLFLKLPRTKHEWKRIDPTWTELIDGASFDGSTTANVYRGKLFSERKRTLDQLLGYVTRGVVDLWTESGSEDNFESTLHQLMSDVRALAIKKGTTIAKRAAAVYQAEEPTRRALKYSAEASLRLTEQEAVTGRRPLR